jgi:hypothetical protein
MYIFQMSDEDLQQQTSEWTEMMAGPDGNFVADQFDGTVEKKDVIDLEGEEEMKRKQMTSRYVKWSHFSNLLMEVRW